MAEKLPEYAEPRIYSREFKLEGARLSEHTEKSVAQIARDLGVPSAVNTPADKAVNLLHRHPPWHSICTSYRGQGLLGAC
ncbi:MAG: transposase [Ktedonobacterales bacterium]